jgi:hypothetical protein
MISRWSRWLRNIMQSRDDDHIMTHIGARLARDIGDGTTDEKLLQFRYFLGNLAEQGIQPASSIRHWVWAPTVVSALLGLAAISWFLFIRNPEVPFWINTPQHLGEMNAPLIAPSDGKTTLQFPSKSEIVLNSGAKAQMVESTKKAVRLQLSSGDIDADINGNGTTRWSIEAGKFKVEVLGTRFSVSWNPERDQLDVKVERGTVRVRDTETREDGIYATKGEHLRRNGTVFFAKNEIDSVDYDASEMGLVRSSHNGGPIPATDETAFASSTAPQLPDAPTTPTIEPPDEVVPNGISPDSTPESQQPKRGFTAPHKTFSKLKRWRKRLKNGEYDEVLQEADTTELQALVESIGAESLWELMNAARRIGWDQTAIDMLLTCRKRFPGTHEANDSAFVLGTQYQKQGSLHKAFHWFDTYLNENPNGELASDANGRTMSIYQQWGDEHRARAAARQYLRENPDGPFEHIARSILGW